MDAGRWESSGRSQGPDEFPHAELVRSGCWTATGESPSGLVIWRDQYEREERADAGGERAELPAQPAGIASAGRSARGAYAARSAKRSN
jgi:hypothetical protein